MIYKWVVRWAQRMRPWHEVMPNSIGHSASPLNVPSSKVAVYCFASQEEFHLELPQWQVEFLLTDYVIGSNTHSPPVGSHWLQLGLVDHHFVVDNFRIGELLLTRDCRIPKCAVVNYQVGLDPQDFWTRLTVRVNLPRYEIEHTQELNESEQIIWHQTSFFYLDLDRPDITETRAFVNGNYIGDYVAESNPLETCLKCRHFHGRSYHGARGSNFLVCAMHPSGMANCSDFKAINHG